MIHVVLCQKKMICLFHCGLEKEEKLCGKVELVREFTYLGDSVIAGGGCDAAVTARTRCWWV